MTEIPDFTVPCPDFAVPDPEVVGARAEAALQWVKDHPDHTLDELMEWYRIQGWLHDHGIPDDLLKERFKHYSTDELVTIYRKAQGSIAARINYASLIHRTIALRGGSGDEG